VVEGGCGLLQIGIDLEEGAEADQVQDLPHLPGGGKQLDILLEAVLLWRVKAVKGSPAVVTPGFLHARLVTAAENDPK
jgi:hypothetical protein